MNSFAVIETGGKQYKVKPGQKIKIEKLATETGADFIFDKVLFKADGKGLNVGRPYLQGESIKAKILKQGRNRKVIVFKYHSKTRYRKKKGHRQFYTQVEILSF